MRVTFKEAQKILETEKDALLLDVREEMEFYMGHAEGAQLFPVDEITEETASERIPDKSTPVLVYCKTGARSMEAAEFLKSTGYTRVYDMGSLVGWPGRIMHGE